MVCGSLHVLCIQHSIGSFLRRLIAPLIRWESFRDFVDVCGEVEEEDLHETSTQAVGPIKPGVDEQSAVKATSEVYYNLREW